MKGSIPLGSLRNPSFVVGERLGQEPLRSLGPARIQKRLIRCNSSHEFRRHKASGKLWRNLQHDKIVVLDTPVGRLPVIAVQHNHVLRLVEAEYTIEIPLVVNPGTTAT